MTTPDKDGVSHQERIEGLLARPKLSAAKRAKYEAEIALPPFPKALRYLWDAFWRIRRRKGGNGFGASPIEWPDIDAFVRNSDVRLSSWEVMAIEDLDDLYLAVRATASANSSQD